MSAPPDSRSLLNREAPAASRVVGRLVGVDGLRACAALLVLTYHCTRFPNTTQPGTLGMFLSELKGGVAVFFVISGFVLYLPYARSIGAGASLPDWRRYAARRAVRILPAYWAALLVLALAGQMNGARLADAWRYVGLVQIYHPSTVLRGLPVAWSLDVEVSFYLALPLLSWLAVWVVSRSVGSRLVAQLPLIIGLGFGSLVLRLLLTRSLVAPVDGGHVVLMTALPGMLDWFALGMGLAVLRAASELCAEVPRALLALAGRPGLCWLIATALFLAGVPAQGGDLFLPTYGVTTHLALGLTGLFLLLPVVSRHPETSKGAVMPFLRSRLLTWLGTISYGIYLWHVSFLKVFYAAVGQPQGARAFIVLLLPTAVAAVCLGAVSWYLVERPAHRLHAAGGLGASAALRKLVGETT